MRGGRPQAAGHDQGLTDGCGSRACKGLLQAGQDAPCPGQGDWMAEGSMDAPLGAARGSGVGDGASAARKARDDRSAHIRRQVDGVG